MKMRVRVAKNVTTIIVGGCANDRALKTSVGNLAVLHDGQNGATFTPSVSDEGVISWTNDREMPNPMPVNIKGEKGEQGEQGLQGVPGKQGEKGEKGDIGAKGDKGDKGDPGKDGANGTNGANGKDGTPCTHRWDGTTLIVTSASGTSSANLKGEKGDTGAQGVQGIQGLQGDRGEKGDKGDPGAQGIQGEQGEKGADGHTPVKGTDYFTDADKQEMVDDVLAKIPPSGVSDVQLNGKTIVDENGVATIPVVTAAKGGYGIVRVGNLANGQMGVRNINGAIALAYPEASINGFTQRKAQGSQYSGVVGSKNFDLAVKVAMTDGVGAAWTEEEQTAARARMGAVSLEEVLAAVAERFGLQ